MRMVYVAAAILFVIGMLAGVAWVSLHRSEPPAKTPPSLPLQTSPDARSSDSLSGNKKVIFEQFDLLNRRDSDEMAFVIFEHRDTKHFVQFTGPHLYADRFVDGLPDEERQVIVSFMEQWPHLTVYGKTHYQVEFGTDIAAARRFAVEMFAEVFNVHDTSSLSVEFGNFH